MNLIDLFNSPRLRQVLLLLYLFIYLIAGFYTELHFIEIKPLPATFMDDFRHYENGLRRALAGEGAYSVREIGPGFLYPPPALLLVHIIYNIEPHLVKVCVFLVVNLFLMAAMVYGVIRYYKYSLEHTWYWFVLCFGFAPFLELLHIGQINMFPLVGIFMMFAYENRQPIISGLGLSLAIMTKVTPIFFFAYLLAQRRINVILITLITMGMLLLLSILFYGIEPIKSYPEIFNWMLNKYPVNANSQSFVSKISLFGQMRFEPLLTHLPEALKSFPNIYNNFINANIKLIHRGLTIYMLIVIIFSSLLTYLGRQPKEVNFIIIGLSMTLSPNILWYHHYVYILLPLLIWIAWSKQKTSVVLWCLLGLLVIQLDRLRWTSGLLIQGFGQLTLLAFMVWQIREYLSSRRRKSKYFSIATISGV